MMHWEKEYLYFRHPDIPATEPFHIQTLEQLRQETDFMGKDAQLFKAGWEHCLHVVGVEVNHALTKVERNQHDA